MGKYVTTVPPTEMMVPFAGGVTIEIPVTVPVSCGDRLMLVATAKLTVTASPAAPGAGERIVMFTRGDVVDVPPGPVARYVKLSGPK